MRATALGSLSDIEQELADGTGLEAKDHWERTAWLIAIQTGDTNKTQLLLDRGADKTARGRCGKPSLFYAIEARDEAMLRWLLARGVDVEERDKRHPSCARWSTTT